jgi:DNA-binding IclR family transcriptional regulator
LNEKVAAAPVRAGYLARLLDLICLVADQPGLSLGEVSRRAGLPLSTASRLVGLLSERGFVRRDGGSGLVAGPSLERVGLRALQRITAIGRFDEHVARLASSFGESVSLGLIDFGRIVLVARRESDHALRMVARVGDIIPPHTSAMGKALLAFMPPERALELLASATPDPAAVLARLGTELEWVREQGYARDEGEFAVGLRCVAAPFFRAGGEPAGAISIAGPSARFTEEQAAAAVRPLLAEVGSISRELGHGE